MDKNKRLVKNHDLRGELNMDKKSENNGKEKNHMLWGMSIGMCLGVLAGSILALIAKGNIALYMCFGISIGMGIGAAIGYAIKKDSNNKSKPKK